jgi:hypothetical protein
MAHTKAALIAKVTSFRRRQKKRKISSIIQVGKKKCNTNILQSSKSIKFLNAASGKKIT